MILSSSNTPNILLQRTKVSHIVKKAKRNTSWYTQERNARAHTHAWENWKYYQNEGTL